MNGNMALSQTNEKMGREIGGAVAPKLENLLATAPPEHPQNSGRSYFEKVALKWTRVAPKPMFLLQ
ncbi:hypothetical protein [Pontibacillus yanchengensis]|uniref:hypothetical protein n=1 Tax=Pontibacillus yanchengensis TaxID=462910 RepID=UPI00136D0E95|nr:hypothetical protein [Pontibacillus yanchengensis]